MGAPALVGISRLPIEALRGANQYAYTARLAIVGAAGKKPTVMLRCPRSSTRTLVIDSLVANLYAAADFVQVALNPLIADLPTGITIVALDPRNTTAAQAHATADANQTTPGPGSDAVVAVWNAPNAATAVPMTITIPVSFVVPPGYAMLARLQTVAGSLEIQASWREF